MPIIGVAGVIERASLRPGDTPIGAVGLKAHPVDLAPHMTGRATTGAVVDGDLGGSIGRELGRIFHADSAHRAGLADLNGSPGLGGQTVARPGHGRAVVHRIKQVNAQARAVGADRGVGAAPGAAIDILVAHTRIADLFSEIDRLAADGHGTKPLLLPLSSGGRRVLQGGCAGLCPCAWG